MTVISVDLVHEQYNDVGVVALRASNSSIGVVPISLPSVGLVGKPEVDELGSFLVSLADELNVASILIDGPQGWKAPDDGLDHSRRCENELGTPTRTGLPGETNPAEHRGFAEFCIALFDELATSLYPRLSTTGSWPTRVAVESLPAAAWHSLGIAALPAKNEATAADTASRLEALQSCFPLDLRGELSLSELQATVAGLAGVALERRNLAGLAFAGVEPLLVDGTWREGYILSPTREAATPPA
jgi:hypothetical protein